MQTLKEEIRRNILTAAKEEFLKCGFSGASVRRIAESAKTSTSNVYNYFEDKNALFAAVVAPALSDLEAAFEHFRLANPASRAASYTLEAQKGAIYRIMRTVFRFEDEFRLLFFCSAGSALSGFKNSATNALADILIDWIQFAAPNKGITNFFIRSLSEFYISAIGQLLAEKKTVEDIDLPNDFLTFIYGGWNALFMSDNEK